MSWHHMTDAHTLQLGFLGMIQLVPPPLPQKVYHKPPNERSLESRQNKTRKNLMAIPSNLERQTP